MMMNKNRMILWILASSILIAALAGCQATATQAPLASSTNIPPTSIPSTNTPEIPTSTPMPVIIPAAGEPIQMLGYSLVITYAGYRDIGYNPWGLTSNMALQFDLEEASGKLDEFIGVSDGIQLVDEQGNPTSNYFRETGTNYKGVTTFCWYILTTDPTGKYYLKFPDGELIDLTPLIK
jgi:hypothetical protein